MQGLGLGGLFGLARYARNICSPCGIERALMAVVPPELTNAQLRLKSSLLLVSSGEKAIAHDNLLAAADELVALSASLQATKEQESSALQLTAQHATADRALLRQQYQQQVALNGRLRREQMDERDRMRAAARAEAAALTERIAIAVDKARHVEDQAKVDALAAEELLARTIAEYEASAKQQLAAWEAERAAAIAEDDRRRTVAAATLHAVVTDAVTCKTSLATEVRGLEMQADTLQRSLARLTFEANGSTREYLRQLAQRDAIIRALNEEIARLRGLVRAALKPEAPPSAWRALHLESLKESIPVKDACPEPQPLPQPLPSKPKPAGCLTFHDLTPRLDPRTQLDASGELARGGLEALMPPPDPRRPHSSHSIATSPRSNRLTVSGARSACESMGRSQGASRVLERTWHAGKWEGWP